MSTMLCPFCDAPDLPTHEHAPERCPRCFQTLSLRGCRIRSLLGAGGMGRVYGAVREEDNLAVAIKMQALSGIDWKTRELFERSCRVLQGLSHQALPKVYAFEENNSGRLFLVGEAFSGGTLEERVKQGKRLTAGEFSKILRAMLELLDYLHGLVPPVFHRDIKPSNIMFKTPKDLAPVLVDFDTVAAPGRQRVGLTIVGTPGYTAPEQFSGIITPASDIYSLGMTMVFVAIHADPDDLPRDAEGRLAIKEDLKTLDPRLRSVLLKMVEPERSNRYTSAKEILSDLDIESEPERRAKEKPKAPPREKKEAEFPVAFHTAPSRKESQNQRHSPKERQEKRARQKTPEKKFSWKDPPSSQEVAKKGRERGGQKSFGAEHREGKGRASAGNKNLSAIERSLQKHNAGQVSKARKGGYAPPSFPDAGHKNHNPSPFAVKAGGAARKAAAPPRLGSGVSLVMLMAGLGILVILAFLLFSLFSKPTEPSYDPRETAKEIAEDVLKQVAPVEAAPQPTGRVFIRIGASPSTGPIDAPVTIVEFSDFECQHCGTAAKTVAELRALYPEKIRLVYMHFPLSSIHQKAGWLHRVSLAAQRQGKFWEFYHFLYQHKASALTEDVVLEEARRQGLDIERFTRDIEDSSLDRLIARDKEYGQKLGVRGTPVFFINGALFKGAQPLEKFRAEVERELLLAKEALQEGVAPERLYEHLSQKDLSR